MNKETNGTQDVGATAFDMPNSQNPYGKPPIHYGSTKVPHPNNSTAEVTCHDCCTRALLQGK